MITDSKLMKPFQPSVHALYALWLTDLCFGKNRVYYIQTFKVRQGCSLSPMLFIICDEAMVREVCHKYAIGVRVGER